jgi:hypothetical protein
MTTLKKGVKIVLSFGLEHSIQDPKSVIKQQLEQLFPESVPQFEFSEECK